MKVLQALGFILILVIAIFAYSLWETHHLVVSTLSSHSDRIPSEFKGFKILHLSDIHGKSFGDHQGEIIEKIRTLTPNIIVISGDSLDRHLQDSEKEASLTLVREASKLAPVYLSLGNHESVPGLRDQAAKILTQAGATVLDNRSVTLTKGADHIRLSGINDPKFFWGMPYFRDMLETLAADAGPDKPFHLLISHRPELLEEYAAAGFDLVFAGHAHGGQVRVPFLGGLAAPNQGFFPLYTSGSHQLDQTQLIISRGLGNRYFVPRVFNPPEMILITLE